jgi:hypothetical protein
VERVAWKGLLARGCLIAAVSVIIGVSTLTPLLKYSSPVNDTNPPSAFAPPLTNQTDPSSYAAPIAKEPSLDVAVEEVKPSPTLSEI